jgi:hypothetical protein
MGFFFNDGGEDKIHMSNLPKLLRQVPNLSPTHEKHILDKLAEHQIDGHISKKAIMKVAHEMEHDFSDGIERHTVLKVRDNLIDQLH